VARPISNEYAPFYAGYVEQYQDLNPIMAIIRSTEEWNSTLSSISEDQKLCTYADGKWTINQLLAHCVDTERIFQYRVLRIAREPEALLSGFNEDDFAAINPASSRSLDSLREEFNTVRQSSLLLFESLSESDYQKTGLADGKTISINALGFIMAGHVKHHLNILNERYLTGES
jgi:uncharacterized damage-inducible protein DinB